MGEFGDEPITLSELHDMVGSIARPARRHEGESAGQALTRRNEELLVAGVHPATRRPLWIGTGEVCGQCDHLRAFRMNRRRYYKCECHRLGMSRSASSDVRIGWPACVLFEMAEGAQR